MSIVTTILTVLGIVALVVGALKGLSQGAPRQLIRLLTIAASIFASIGIAALFYNKVSGFFDGKTSEELYNWVTGLKFIPAGIDFSWMMNFDPAALKDILIIPMTLITLPLICTGVFAILYGLTKIVHVILCGVFGLSKKRNNLITRLLGILLGAVEGVAVLMMFILPIVGLSSSVETAVAVINEKYPEEESTESINEIYTTYLQPVTEHTTVKTLGKLGGNAIFEGLVTVEEEGEKINMSDLLPDALQIYANAGKLKGYSWQNLSPEHKEGIQNISDVIESNPYFTRLASNVLRGFAQAIENGAIPVAVEPPFDTIVNEALTIFATSTPENLNTDIDTILSVYFLLSDHQILASFNKGSDEMLSALTKTNAEGKTPVSEIIEVIKQNERTKPLITFLTKLSVSVMADSLGLDENTVETYENIKTGLNETLKIDREDFTEGEEGEEEYKAAISESIDTTLKDNGIEIEPEIVDTMADYVADNFEEIEEITDDEINDVILSYFDAYVKYLETGTLPDDLPINPDDIPGEIPGT